MSRLLWMGIGAAGGIYVYRKGQRTWERAKVRGVAGNATMLAATAAQWYARGLAGAELGAASGSGAAAPLHPTSERDGAATATPTFRASRAKRGWGDDDGDVPARSVAELAYGAGRHSRARPSTLEARIVAQQGTAQRRGAATGAAGGAAAAGAEALGNWLVRRAAAARSA